MALHTLSRGTSTHQAGWGCQGLEVLIGAQRSRWDSPGQTVPAVRWLLLRALATTIAATLLRRAEFLLPPCQAQSDWQARVADKRAIHPQRHWDVGDLAEGP